MNATLEREDTFYKSYKRYVLPVRDWLVSLFQAEMTTTSSLS